jgi:hypothetical protein
LPHPVATVIACDTAWRPVGPKSTPGPAIAAATEKVAYAVTAMTTALATSSGSSHPTRAGPGSAASSLSSASPASGMARA